MYPLAHYKSASTINIPRVSHPARQLYWTDTVKRISHLRLSLFLFCSMVTPRSTPPLLCQRSLLLGRSVPIRQGARPFETPKEHETEPGRDVSWLPHLPVSGMVKLLSWGVTLGVLCVLFKLVCVSVCVCVCVFGYLAKLTTKKSVLILFF